MKKTHFKKISKNFLLYEFIIICIALIVSCAIMLNEYQKELDEQANTTGYLYSKEMALRLEATVNSYIKKVERLAGPLNGTFESDAEFAAELRYIKAKDLSGSNDDIMFIRYYKDGVEHKLNDDTIDMRVASKTITELVKRDYTTCAGVVIDHDYKYSAVAFCTPLKNSPYADALVFYFDIPEVVKFPELHDAPEIQKSDITAVCTDNGELISILYSNDLKFTQRTNIYEEVRYDINDKSIIDKANTLIYEGASDAMPAVIYGTKYVLAISSIKDNDASPFAILSLYKSVNLYSTGYSVISTVLGVLMVFFGLLIISAVYIVIMRNRTEKSLREASDTDKRLNCPSKEKFETTAADIISRNKQSSFAVIAIDIKHYNYISAQLSADQLTQVLQYLKMIYSKKLQLDETYGYLSNGCFALLLHFRDRDGLEAKLKELSSMAWSYTRKISGNLHISLFGGIYYTSSNITTETPTMLELATKAKDAMNVPYDFGSFRSYNEQLHANLVETEYIEMRMEDALKNKEFKIFYQPTYSIARNTIDGCEALMRWYNAEKDTYMQPGVFIPLFEANGFMAKIDRYVFEQVCIFIKEAFDSDQKIYPISINISRITASEQGFLNYYIATKRKYGVPDNYLSLEFTENFAYEDFDMMRSIIADLKANGFRCVIDDFGSGIASMRILKELPVDEIKLDRSFIVSGISKERDEKVLGSIIRTAKELKIKVSQKGVETDDQLAMLTKLGCQVTQGYHFAKPLYLTDYIDFINRTTEKPKFSSNV